MSARIPGPDGRLRRRWCAARANGRQRKTSCGGSISWSPTASLSPTTCSSSRLPGSRQIGTVHIRRWSGSRITVPPQTGFIRTGSPASGHSCGQTSPRARCLSLKPIDCSAVVLASRTAIGPGLEAMSSSPRHLSHSAGGSMLSSRSRPGCRPAHRDLRNLEQRVGIHRADVVATPQRHAAGGAWPPAALSIFEDQASPSDACSALATDTVSAAASSAASRRACHSASADASLAAMSSIDMSASVTPSSV